MKSFIISLLATIWVTSVFANGYISMHQGNLLGEYKAKKDSIANGDYLQFTYSANITKSASKGDVNLPFYTPNGWNSYKIYLPSGTDFMTMDITPMHNSSLRIDMKYQGVNGNVIDHSSEIPKQDKTWEADEKTISIPATPNVSLDIDTATINSTGGGWLYIDIVEDNFNLTSYFPDQVTNPVVKITLQLHFSESIENWLSATTFINGDPSDEFDQLTVLTYPSAGEVTTTSVNPIVGTDTYSTLDSYSGGGTYTPPVTTTPTTTTPYTPPPASTTPTVGGNTCPTGTYMTVDGSCAQTTSSTYTPPAQTTTTSSTNCSLVPDPFNDLPICSATTPATTTPATTTSGNTCPTGTTMNASGECVQSASSSTTSTPSTNTGGNTCPTGTTMNSDGECTQSPSESAEPQESKGVTEFVPDSETIAYVKANYSTYGLFSEAEVEEAVNKCKNDPASCGIESVALPLSVEEVNAVEPGSWQTLAVEAETPLSVVEDTIMVLVNISGTWKAYSPYKSIREEIKKEGYEILDFIPANSVIWIIR